MPVATILLAGEGKRLRPYTNDRPKALVEVHGRSILERALVQLAHQGCTSARLVVGHLADVVLRTIPPVISGMPIAYIHNSRYSTTNSMFSLALGLDGLEDPTWVIEGDVLFEESILTLSGAADICWFVDSSARDVDGAFLEAGSDGRAVSLDIVRDLRNLRAGQAKSVGMLRLSREGVVRVREWLQAGIREGREGDYYDLVLRDHFAEARCELVDVSGRRWVEVDTPEDLARARTQFP